MIHLLPLVGHADHPGYQAVLDAALQDAATLVGAGFEVILIENNYDVPHQEIISPEAAKMMREITREVANAIELPIGICVLWNDYRHAFEIAKAVDGAFIRVPVFVDDVDTDYGRLTANPQEVLATRHALGAEHIKIYVDVQVKHATMVTPRPLADSVAESIQAGADGLIITGQWTADRPRQDDLRIAREVAEGRPIVVGSGATAKNVGELLEYADAVIVGTALKKGELNDKSIEPNLAPASQRLDMEAAKAFKKGWDDARQKLAE